MHNKIVPTSGKFQEVEYFWGNKQHEKNMDLVFELKQEPISWI